MNSYSKTHQCLNCEGKIDLKVFEYSSQHFGVALCFTCQKWLKAKIPETTRETIDLYFSLRKRGVPAQLEKNDCQQKEKTGLKNTAD